MIHITKNNIKYTLIPDENWLENIQKSEEIFNNNIYEKYKINLNINGELIVCTDINKTDIFNNKNIQETYEEYLETISKQNLLKDQWIYNIIDGLSEQNKILYQNNNIIIIPNYTWNENSPSKIHLLTIPKNKSIRCIRSLDSTHIDLLNEIKNKTIDIIKNKFGFEQNQLKIFVHYAPSTYHFHVHFALIINTDINSSVEYSYDLSTIIYNLEINSNYYKLAKLNKRV